jgi:hypothetical protein
MTKDKLLELLSIVPGDYNVFVGEPTDRFYKHGVNKLSIDNRNKYIHLGSYEIPILSILNCDKLTMEEEKIITEQEQTIKL